MIVAMRTRGLCQVGCVCLKERRNANNSSVRLKERFETKEGITL